MLRVLFCRRKLKRLLDRLTLPSQLWQQVKYRCLTNCSLTYWGRAQNELSVWEMLFTNLMSHRRRNLFSEFLNCEYRTMQNFLRKMSQIFSHVVFTLSLHHILGTVIRFNHSLQSTTGFQFNCNQAGLILAYATFHIRWNLGTALDSLRDKIIISHDSIWSRDSTKRVFCVSSDEGNKVQYQHKRTSSMSSFRSLGDNDEVSTNKDRISHFLIYTD